MSTNKTPLSIKAIVIKNLRESKEPFFYLAPDVVGSINNAHPTKSRKFFVIDFNTIDNQKANLTVPNKCYSQYKMDNPSEQPGMDMVKNFLMKFLEGAKPYVPQEGTLDEMVDEFGELYGEKDDLPANIRGNPGQGQTKNTATAMHQFANPNRNLYQTNMGYGALTW